MRLHIYCSIIAEKLRVDIVCLFDDNQEQARLAEVVDALNKKHKGAVGVASMMGAEKQVPTRIAFGAPDVD